MATPIKDVGNKYDPDRVGNAVKHVEAIEADIASITGEHMAACKSKRADIKAVLDEAKTAWGIPKKEIRIVLKDRALERKREALRADLEPDESDNVELLMEALGAFHDTPLGEAAKRGKPANGKGKGKIAGAAKQERAAA